MRWSKIRKELQDLLAENLKGRLDYHITTYKNSTGYIGRAWITWDGNEILNFSNQDTWNEFESYSNETAETQYMSHKPVPSENRSSNQIMEKGEFSKYDFTENAFRFLNINVREALESDNPILKALAIVDRRIGKRTLSQIDISKCHPIHKQLLSLRLNGSATHNNG